MKTRIAIVVLALTCLGWYLTTVLTPPSARPAAVATELAQLSGVWEGIGPGDLPARLAVEEIHEHWVTVSYTWGEHPDGRFHKGWTRVKAKVLPDGKLFWRHPGNFTFQLSEDRTTLVGTRDQCGLTASSLMRRVPSENALNLDALD